MKVYSTSMLAGEYIPLVSSDGATTDHVQVVRLDMPDSSRTMHGHVALRLRLVYQSSGSVPSRSDVPGWELVGVLPEDAADDAAESAPEDFGAEPAGAAEAARNRRRLLAPPVTLTLDRDEVEGYYLNLTSPEPSLFALLRVSDVASATASRAAAGLPETVAVTVSYAEAARWMDGGMVVIRTPLPGPLPAWIAEFTQYHWPAEGPKKRGKYRPSFLSRQDFGEKSNAALQELGQAASSATRH